MGHNISVLIGKAPINDDEARQYGLAVAFENGFAITILDWYHMEYWSGKLDFDVESYSEYIEWDSELSWYWAQELGWSRYAIVQLDYHGFYGCLYEDGDKVIAETDIHTILSSLGVPSVGHSDAFDTLNLNAYRQSEHYYLTKGRVPPSDTSIIWGCDSSQYK